MQIIYINHNLVIPATYFQCLQL